jgi:hypothetical protein
MTGMARFGYGTRELKDHGGRTQSLTFCHAFLTCWAALTRHQAQIG